MQRWEYLFVSCDRAGEEWRPRHVNGAELPGWEGGPALHEWANERGAEGWELVGLASATVFISGRETFRLVFKRPRA